MWLVVWNLVFCQFKIVVRFLLLGLSFIRSESKRSFFMFFFYNWRWTDFISGSGIEVFKSPVVPRVIIMLRFISRLFHWILNPSGSKQRSTTLSSLWDSPRLPWSLLWSRPTMTFIMLYRSCRRTLTCWPWWALMTGHGKVKLQMRWLPRYVSTARLPYHSN